MTRRDLQGEAKKLRRPWEIGKAFEKSAPCGPLVPASQIGHPDQGAIWLKVNGALQQEGDLNQMIWKLPEIIAILSRYFALQPGDVIMTGTPAGVGPITRGDVMEGHVAGVGNLTVKVVLPQEYQQTPTKPRLCAALFWIFHSRQRWAHDAGKARMPPIKNGGDPAPIHNLRFKIRAPHTECLNIRMYTVKKVAVVCRGGRQTSQRQDLKGRLPNSSPAKASTKGNRGWPLHAIAPRIPQIGRETCSAEHF